MRADWFVMPASISDGSVRAKMLPHKSDKRIGSCLAFFVEVDVAVPASGVGQFVHPDK